MGMYCDWTFHGKNNDGSALTEKQIDRLMGQNEYDFSDLNIIPGEEMFAFGETISFSAIERIEEALKAFATAEPVAELTVYYRAETDEAPLGFHVKDGKLRRFSAQISYYYDDDGKLLND